MSTVSISTFQIADYNYGGSTAKLRLYASQNWTDSAGNPYIGGSHAGWFQEISLSVSGTTITVPTFSTVSTLDALDYPMTTIDGVIYDHLNTRREVLFSGWSIPTNTPTTWAQLQIFNLGSLLVQAPDFYLNRQETIDLINSIAGTLNDASTIVKGRTMLSVAPAVPSSPIAVGDNDPRVGMYINAKSPAYGAVGDGVTNDAAAIQLGINASVTAGIPLFLPKGDYFTGSTVLTTATTSNAKLQIEGAGKGITRITRTNGVANSVIDIVLTGASSIVKVSNLTIVGPTGLAFDNNAIGINWITAAIGHRLRVEQVEVTGTLDHSILNSVGGTVEIIDCDLTATDVCCAMFESSDTANSASFYARGGTWQTPNGDLTSLGSVGLYIHPHIPYIVEGVTFKTLGRYAFYQNGSPGSARKYANAIGCVFIDCEMAQTKNTGPSNFTGCQLQGSSSALGSSLGGTVNVGGCTFKEGGKIGYGAITVSKVTISNCSFLDTPVFACGDPVGEWEIRASTFRLTDNAPAGSAFLRCVSGTTILNNVAFIDETGSLSYQSFIVLQGTAPAVRANAVSTKGGRGTLSSGFYGDVGTLQIENCDFDAGTTKEALYMATGFPAESLTGSNNRFRNGAYVFVQNTATQQRLTRRVGVNPTSVVSAASMSSVTSDMCNYDMHVATGSAAIANLTLPHTHAGILRLVVAAGGTWSTANSGNILPLTTSARAAGAVVTLLWEPTAAKWLEA